MIIQLKSFPDNLGLVISTMEVFAGLGGILGPFVGGTLFDLGGYVAPFYGCGGFQLFTLLGMEWNAWSRCAIYVVPVFWAFLAILNFHDSFLTLWEMSFRYLLYLTIYHMFTTHWPHLYHHRATSWIHFHQVCIFTVNPIGEFNIKVKLVDYVKLIRLKSILICCFLTGRAFHSKNEFLEFSCSTNKNDVTLIPDDQPN